MLKLSGSILASVSVSVSLAQAPNGSVVAGPAYQGEEIACHLPANEHIKNIGSRRDGLGMCVSSSIEMAALWAGIESFRGFRNWCAKEPGGSWPEKTDDQIRRYCKEKGIEVPAYIQYEGRDIEAILESCDRTRRMACVTYGYSPRYGKTIAHMVCLPNFAGEGLGKLATVLDNNFPGENSYEWMNKSEAVKRISHPRGQGWIFVWLAPAPPPAPVNLKGI